MPTRRGFFHASLGAAAVAALPHALATLARPNKTLPYLADKPLLQLQQEFVDLRFVPIGLRPGIALALAAAAALAGAALWRRKWGTVG